MKLYYNTRAPLCDRCIHYEGVHCSQIDLSKDTGRPLAYTYLVKYGHGDLHAMETYYCKAWRPKDEKAL